MNKAFFLGGNATFTVQSGKTGKHLTFKIRKPEASATYPNPAYLVSAMTGTDNESHFTYLGKLCPMTGSISLTPKSKFPNNDERVIVARWALDKVWNDKPVIGGSSIQHEGKCGCCGRKLTNPESLASGIGPECSKKLGLD